MSSTNLNSTLEINRISDVEDDKLIFIQEVKKGEELERRTLIFDPRRCSGCCVCVYSCPVNAIQFAGYEMLMAGMPLIIDHTNCVFCGICFALCPDRAFDFKVSNEISNADSEIKSVFFKLKGGALKLDECIDCLICPTVCPAEAVNFRILTKIDDLHKRLSGVKGKLKIDTEECKLCGICTAFCDALVAIENTDFKSKDFKPFSEILLREERCDFCGLCEYVCPNQAIKVESENKSGIDEEIKVLEVEFTDKCIECGICELACPYEGVKVEKSFEGEIDVLWNRLDKFCDVESCKACINVCKSKAWELSEGKLELNTELCRFCRACANVCPEKLIDVKLSCINVEWSLESLGEKPGGWLKAIERVLKGCIEPQPELKLKFESSEEEIQVQIETVHPKRKGIDKSEKEKLDALRKILKNPGYRRMLETRPEKFLNSVKNLRG